MTVGNQQKWDTVEGERSGVVWSFCEIPEGPVVASSPFDRLSLHLLLASQGFLPPFQFPPGDRRNPHGRSIALIRIKVDAVLSRIA